MNIITLNQKEILEVSGGKNKAKVKSSNDEWKKKYDDLYFEYKLVVGSLILVGVGTVVLMSTLIFINLY
jgi:hypothetical protein